LAVLLTISLHLPSHHRDPFDRLLVAQAQLEADAVFSRYDVTVIDARDRPGIGSGR
jgi:PIN domain nuclease of toxin-antitoxin system